MAVSVPNINLNLMQETPVNSGQTVSAVEGEFSFDNILADIKEQLDSGSSSSNEKIDKEGNVDVIAIQQNLEIQSQVNLTEIISSEEVAQGQEVAENLLPEIETDYQSASPRELSPAVTEQYVTEAEAEAVKELANNDSKVEITTETQAVAEKVSKAEPQVQTETTPAPEAEKAVSDNNVLDNTQNSTQKVQTNTPDVELTTGQKTEQASTASLFEKRETDIKIEIESMAEKTLETDNVKVEKVSDVIDKLEKESAAEEVTDNLKMKQAETFSSFENNSEENYSGQENSSNEEEIKLTVDNDISRSEFLNSDKNIILNKIMDTMNTQPVKQDKTVLQTNILKQTEEALGELTTKNPKVNIILQPENLGKVLVELQSGKDGLVAKFAVNSAEVKEIFDKNIDGLKSSLAAQGVNVDNIVVKLDSSANVDNNYLNFQNEQFKQNSNTNTNPNRQNGYKDAAEKNENALTAEEAEEGENETVTQKLDFETGRVDYRV